VGLNTIRYIVPAVLVVIGFVILFTAGESLRWEGWAMCVGAGLAVLLLNVLYRYGATGDQERQDEDDAREYFGKHGRWPDDNGN
jgi:chromate transport protein ChrA